jgi:hypothetical protein
VVDDLGDSAVGSGVVVARPRPSRDFAQGMQLVLGTGVGVLHRHPRAELHVLTYRRAKLWST